MHKLRLRAKSSAGRSSSSEDRENAGNGRDAKDGGKLKASIRHVGADAGLARKGSKQQQRQPKLMLGTEDSSFRTSLILPHLTKRFALLRAEDGSLVSLDQMQQHLRVQRDNGRLTESEERAVMQEYRLQSMYEATRPNGNVSTYSPTSLDTLQEESGSIDERQSQAPSFHGASTMSSRQSSSEDTRSNRSPYTPNSSQNHQHYAPASPWLGASLPASTSSSGGSTPVSSGFASSSTAEFYAARDAVLRGNGLFGGGGLERDVLSKMAKSPSSQGSVNHTGVFETSTTSEPGTPSSSLSKQKPRQRRLASSDSSSLHSDDGNFGTARANQLVPPVPKIQYKHKEEDEYDPYRPKDADDEQERQLPRGIPSSNLGLDQPMSRKQFNRISRVLEDIEAELTKTHRRIAPLDEEGEEELHNNGTDYPYRQGEAEEEEEEEMHDENDNSNNSGYSNGFSYEEHERERLYHSSSASSSDHHHYQQAFVYDDTEEIDPPLSRLPSQQEFDMSNSPRIEYPDDNDNESGEEQKEYRTSSSSHPSVAATEKGIDTDHPATHSDSTLHITTMDESQNRLSARSSPGLPYLQATPPPPTQAPTFPNSASMQSMTSNGTSSSSDRHPPISAVQPNFSHHPYPQQPHNRQNSQSNNNTRSAKKTPTHSRANSSASSLNPPLSPPPTYGLPPLPDSSSSGSIGSLMMQQSNSADAPSSSQPTSNGMMTMSSVDSNASSLYKISQPVFPPTTSSTDPRAPRFSTYSFPHSVTKGSLPASAGSNFSLQKYLHDPGQASPKGTSFEGFETTKEEEEEDHLRGGVGKEGGDGDGVRPDSMMSTGSSWKGGAHDSLAGSDLDLSRLSLGSLPSSPSKSQTIHKMQEIAEEGSSAKGSESDVGHGDMPEEEIKRFLQNNADGMSLQDLQMIQQRLVETAMSRAGSQDKDEPSVEGATPTAEGERDNQMEVRASASQMNVASHQLGSPFLDQEQEAGDISVASQTSALPEVEPKSPMSAVPALNALRGRSSPGHPGSRPNSRPSSPFQRTQLQRKESASSMRKSQSAMSPSRMQDTATSPNGGRGGDGYFNLQRLQDERAEARDPVHDGQLSPKAEIAMAQQSPPLASSVAPTTLRPKQTRASNSTPSMLIRHVQQQASEATAALKQPNIMSSPPVSPDYGSSSGTRPPPQPRRTLSNRKSAKNLKIGSPQLVSASANLENMPSIDTRTVRSPTATPENQKVPDLLARNQSSAGMKFKMRFKSGGGKKENDDVHEDGADGLPASPLARAPVLNGSIGSKASSSEIRNGGDAHAGIRQLMSKFKKRKPSEALSPRLLPDPLILNSPSISSQLGGPRSPAFFQSFPGESRSPNGQYASPNAYLGEGRRDIPSTISNGTDPMIDTSPLAITPKGSPDAKKIQSHSPEQSLQVTPGSNGKDVDRHSAASLDSMRKLFEAATALGLDSDRVNELIDAAGYNSKSPTSDPGNKLVRSSIILPPPSSPVQNPMTPPQRQMDPPHKRATSSASSMKRSQSARERKTSVSQVADTSISPATTSSLRHRRQSSDAGNTSTASTRRSVHDRPPTPPPSRATHKRQKSDALAAAEPLPASPPTTINHWPSPITHPAFATSSSPAMSYSKSGSSSASDQLGLPIAPFMRNTRASVVSARSFGSYDAKSIYGLYGDDEEDVPPTPSMHEIDMVLASGRIPGASSDNQRASMTLAPGMTAKRLSKVSRNSRIELAEYANGDIAFNIIQSLRGGGSGSNSAPSNRDTFFPVDSHRRQASEVTLEEEELATPLATSPNKPPLDADPLRLLVKRNQKMRKDQEEAEAARTNGQYRKDRSDSADSLSSSQRSVLEVYEAADEAQVAALIEELTRGLDEGQFNLSRTGTISNSNFRSKELERSPSSTSTTPTRGAATSLTRTPSRVKRQPAPTS